MHVTLVNKRSSITRTAGVYIPQRRSTGWGIFISGPLLLIFRVLAASIATHLLVLSFFYERVHEENAAMATRQAIRVEIKKTVSIAGAESKNQDPSLPQVVARNNESKSAPEFVRLQDEPVTTSLATNSHKFERVTTDSSVNERQLESGTTLVRTLSQNGLREYGINVAREARKHKSFPALARQRGWEGEVSVGIGYVAGSSLPLVSLSKGSGYGALDQAALEMVRAAVREAPIPEDLHGRAFFLTLPIRYSLEE